VRILPKDLIIALEQIEREKGISKQELLEFLEAALVTAYKKNFGTPGDIRIEINEKTGDIRVFSRKEVVEEPDKSLPQISLEEAKKINPKVKLGDILELEIPSREFGRIAAQTAKQVIFQKIKEAEREAAFHEYADKEGELLAGVVRRREGQTVYLDLGKAEGVLLPKEQVPGERYEIGGRYQVLLLSVQRTPRGPELIVSRAHPTLVLRLFELEVPEIYEGRVEVKSIAREPGQRTKVAVASREERIDPVGACVGPKGSRIQAIVRELRGERIDIIRFSKNMEEYIANALSPAKINRVELDEKNRMARIFVSPDQLSLAIGKEGQNARLAAKLTNWKIDIQSEEGPEK
jgi:N utilization substance protein A